MHPRSPVALAGLQAGDVLLEFDDLDVTQMYYEEISFVQPVGVSSRFKVQRGEEVMEVVVTRVGRS